MRFSTRDLLWLMVVVAVACLLLVQRQQFLGQSAYLRKRIAELEKLAAEPHSVTIGQDKHSLPPGTRRAIVEFDDDGSATVGFEDVPNQGTSQP
jgi:hypothetical protein